MRQKDCECKNINKLIVLIDYKKVAAHFLIGCLLRSLQIGMVFLHQDD